MHQETKEITFAIAGLIAGVLLLFAICGGSFGLLVRAFKFFAG